ncbi:AraC family transcriptional regulator [Clostridium sp. Marseille-P2415]|uniref:AraC family transcriptional regulator n=1 Tax=Clostridium sp. Marseille-P2415 TaxID=1805471 RepID=UPI00098888A5|nr:AraC family transcriptional regulator [Clostridium sp. Marseille-P2415]
MRYIEYQEKREHGTFSFPFAFYNVSPRHPRYVMTYHWHKETEIIRVLEGSFPILLDNKEYRLNAGDWLLVPSGVLHGGFPENCHYECLVFHFERLYSDSNITRAICRSFTEKNLTFLNLFTQESHPDLLDSLRLSFEAAASQFEGYQLCVLGNLFSALGCILKCHYYTQPPIISAHNKKKITQYKTVLSYIADHYSEDITLNDLAGSVHMNSRYFCRFFKEFTGQTPMEYLNVYRIEAACEQLTSTTHTVTEIAFNCGYNDINYFIRVFKKVKNCTPGRYLKKL